MTPAKARPTPEGDAPKLEMAARVADAAAEEPLYVDGVGPDEQKTLAKGADADYRQAIDDIAFLVAMRREVSESDPFDVPSHVALAGSDSSDEHETIGNWGPFELLERLGGGACGEVFKVRDRNLKNHVALKLFHEERVASVELDTLLVEGRQHALVKHPNIAVIHGADENDGRVGIWMEYLDGATLQELVQTQGTFGAAEATTIARELCSALAAVHQQGLTHGDIKAQNVMREKGGRIVLMDFSSSRHVELDDESSGVLVGTPIYMAPELFDGRPSDFRSDIYAIGVLLFYLVTGRHPFEADNLKGLKDAVRTRRPLLLDDLRPDLPPGFIRAVNRATARAPEERFQSAGELQAALREAIVGDTDGVPVHRVEPVPDLTPLVRAARVVTGSVLVASFLALLGFANEFNYNAVLHVSESFTDYSLANAVVVGLRSLAITIVLAVLELIPIAIVWGLVATFAPDTAKKGRRFVRRFGESLRRRDFDRLATTFTIACVSGLVVASFLFRELLSLLVQLAEAGGEHNLDLSLLGAASLDEHIRFALVFSQLCLLMVAGWIVVFELVGNAQLSTTARFMKWLSALTILVAFTVMSTPWKLLWKNESLPVMVDGTKGYVVAENDDAWFVYIPGKQHVQIPAGSARAGETPENIFGRER